MYRIAACALISFGLLAQEQAVRNVYSIEKEEALGRQLAEDLRSRSKPLDSPIVQAYLNRIGERIASNIPSAPIPFQFSAIDGVQCRDVPEPVAFPGGYVVVSASLLLAVQNEAEFTAILAHAMQHVTLRHGTRQATRGMATNYASIPLIFTGGWCGVSSLNVPAGFMAQQRLDELEADRAAANTLARTGIDTKSLERYIQRAVPNSEQRVAALTSVTGQMPAVETTAASDEFEAVQREVRRLTMSLSRAKEPPTLRR